MSAELEARYRQVLAGFSLEELSRLPLAYSVYGDDLGSLVGSIPEDSSPLNPADLSRLYELLAELARNLQQQAELVELQDQNFPWDETERENFQEELAVLSEATYSKILTEYFFLMGFVDLIAVVREAIVERHSETSFEPIEELVENTRNKLVEIFQEIDGLYESVRNWIADNSS